MNARRFFMIILAAIGGEIALIFFTTIAQEVLVDGVHWGQSSNLDLVLGGVATLIAGVLVGMVASAIGGRDNSWPHAFITIFILSETAYLISAEKTQNPLWFAIVSSICLIITLWLGFYLYKRIRG